MIEAIQAFIQTELLDDPSQAIGYDQDLLLSGAIDSLSVVHLIDFIEREAHLRVSAEDVIVENFGTLRRMQAYVDRSRTEVDNLDDHHEGVTRD